MWECATCGTSNDDAISECRCGRPYRSEPARGRIKRLTEELTAKGEDAERYFERGCAYLELSDPARAIADFDASIRLTRDSAASFKQRAWSLFKAGDYERAVEDLGEIIRLEPANATAYEGRAFIFTRLGDLERAAQDLGEVMRLLPRDASACVRRGNIYLDLGRYQEACDDFNRALVAGWEFSPKTDALRGRAEARLALGDYQGAAEDFGSRVVWQFRTPPGKISSFAGADALRFLSQLTGETREAVQARRLDLAQVHSESASPSWQPLDTVIRRLPRQRSKELDVSLLLATIAAPLFAAMYYGRHSWASDIPYTPWILVWGDPGAMPLWMSLSLAVLATATLVFLIGIWRWRKWGACGLGVSAGLWLAVCVSFAIKFAVNLQVPPVPVLFVPFVLGPLRAVRAVWHQFY